MVQAVENLTQISGTITARKPHPSLSDYDVVTVRLAQAEAVPGKANLLAARAGGDVDVAVRRDLLGDAAVRSQLRCRAKFTPDGAMCEPHPASGDFAVDPP
jgi:hypothetical protein